MNLTDLKVPLLKAQLLARGKDGRGSKAKLVGRLNDALREEGIDVSTFVAQLLGTSSAGPGVVDSVAAPEVEVQPEDSASQAAASPLSPQVSGPPETPESLQVQESAKQAALRVQMKFLKERQTLERRQQELKMMQEEMELQEELEKSEAREAVLTGSRPGSVVASAVGKSPSVKSDPPPPVPRKQAVAEEPSNPQESLMKKLLTASLLPKPDIPIFSGDVTRFHQFIRAFDGRVGSIVDDDDKLYYLEQFTGGTPRDIIRGCMFMKSGGYQEARRLLVKRYGSHDRVTESFIDRLMQWQSVKADDVSGLDRLAVEMRTCHNAVGSLMGASNELDHPKTLKKILEKLPFAIQERWRREVDSLSEREGRSALFSDLVSLIEVEARIASNAAFGRQAFSKKEAPRAEKPRGTNTRCNYAASRDMEARKESCALCKQAHSLDGCPAFAQKPLSGREEFVRQQSLCFGCLKSGHRSRWCKSRLTCTVCGKGHPSILHRYQAVRQGDQRSTVVGEESLPQAAVNVVSAGNGAEVATKMPIVPVKVKYRDGPVVEAYAFLDSGSSSTFCSQALLDKLGISAPKTRLSITTMAKDPLNVWTAAVEGLVVTDMDENEVIHLPVVFSMDKIPASREEVCRLEDLSDWPYLHNVVPADIEAEVELLIGVNVPAALEPVDFIPSRDGGPFAVKTKLGWVLNGPVRNQKWTKMRSTANRIQVELQQLQLEENLASEERGWSVEDHRWLKKVEDGLKMSDGHYEMPLPLKTKLPLPDNSEVALRRLQSLKNRFTDDEFANEYAEFMKNMFDKGYAERVPDQDLKRCDGKVSYIPHHGVQGQKSGKIRVVFDCSSTFRGVSLNDSLLQGPDLTTPLVDVLLRFRQEQVAFIGDVESMFYQVQVPQEDRDLLRFFWWPDGDTAQAPEMYRMTVHPFGARSSPSIANYALRRTAEDCGDEFSSETRQTVKDNFYVDDCLKSVDSVEKAVEVVQELRDLCQRGGFRLTKFVSNSREVLQSIPPEERGKQVRDLALDEDLPSEKALGVQWLVESDVIGFAVSPVSEKPWTRRGMLSVIGSVYDPLGMGAPFVLHGRLILQELTRRKLHWDDVAPDDIAVKWIRWLEDIPLLSEACLPRCMKPDGFGSVVSSELHHFSDASSQGYGVVSYLRFTNDSGKVHCAFVFGKSRLTPLKGMTIPRLELTAAVLAARVDVMLRRALQISVDRSVFWTDSTTVIRYIRNEHTRFHTFVANRVALIRDASSPEQWRYVDSSQNPADDASRGQSGEAFVTNDRWFKGPNFLWKESNVWPSSPKGLDGDPGEDDPEVKRIVRAVLVTADRDPLSALFQHYSSWQRLRRAVAWILRIKCKLKEKTKKRTTVDEDDPRIPLEKGADVRRLTVADLRDAEEAIVRHVQRTSFAEDYASLEASRYVRSKSNLARLDPLFVDGLIKVGGRLTYASVPEDRKHPIIMPKDHHVVDLIVRQVHEDVGHGGREHVLAEIRKRYWIIKGNAAVRRVLSRCLICRRRNGPFLDQKLADLPADRVMSDEPPFSSTGVDMFGPFFVKRGRGQEKRYGVVFTCLSSRAVHIETAASLSTDSFLCALRRFLARRGEVKRIRSDRGTNFLGASKELMEEMDKLMKEESVIQRALERKDIEWIFNTPDASHHGGVWERMIRSIRKVLDGLLTQQVLTDELLQTLLCEVEAILNSRPLTHVSTDHRDPEPLTPNHLLLVGGKVPVPVGTFEKDDLYVKRRWRQVQYLADLFWSRWRNEYIPLLQSRQRWLFPKKSLSEGDVVLVADRALPRNQWPLGRVVETRVSSDGRVRSVKLKVKGTELWRPVTKLVFMS